MVVMGGTRIVAAVVAMEATIAAAGIAMTIPAGVTTVAGTGIEIDGLVPEIVIEAIAMVVIAVEGVIALPLLVVKDVVLGLRDEWCDS